MPRSRLTFTVCLALFISTHSMLSAQEFQREVDTIPVIINGISVASPFSGRLFNSSKPTLADIDDDGDFDLFVGKRTGRINFYRNTGTIIEPTFILETENFFSIDAGDFSTPTFADIDSDGDLDLFVGESDGNINFYRNTGTTINPTFTLEEENFADINVGRGSSPTFADIDSDGDLDLFVGENDGNINFYRNTGTTINPTFTLEEENFADINVRYDMLPTLADIDNDSDLDLFVGEGDGKIYFYRNTGSATDPAFTPVTDVTEIFQVSHDSAPTFADIDNDGDLDLFEGESNGNVNFYRNTGTVMNSVFTLVTKNLDSIDVGWRSFPTLVDIDNDGDVDLFVGKEYAGTINFYRNTGTATEPTFTLETETFADIDGGSGSHPAFADLDNDGDLDLFVDLTFYRNTGTATNPNFMLEDENFVDINVKSGSFPAFADIDNDGDFDLFLGNGYIFFYRNIGTITNPNFTLETRRFANISAGGYATPALADIDNDGDLDLFVGGYFGNIHFYRNTGTVTNPIFTLETANLADINVEERSKPALADIDNDGDFDMFVGEGGGGLHFYRTGPGPGILVSPTDLSFGEVSTNTTKAQILTIFNPGTGTLVINNIISDNTTFSLPGATSFNINPQSSNNVMVRFSPNGDGHHVGNVIINNNVSDPSRNPTIITTSGYGVMGSDVTIFQREIDTIPVIVNGVSIHSPFSRKINSSKPTFADIDNDDDFDMFVGDGHGNINFFRNIGTATIPLFTLETDNFSDIDIGSGNSPIFVDIDNDGDFDLFVGEFDGNINFYRNSGTATRFGFILETENFDNINVSDSSFPTFVDIDNDGDFDLFVGGYYGNINFYRNAGTVTDPNFILESRNFADIDVGSFSTPTFTDIDNDGDLDLFIGEQDGNINFYRNAGTVTNSNFILETQNFADINTESCCSYPSFIDIDNDGDVDLFVGEINGNINFYQNTGTVTEPTPILETEQFGNVFAGIPTFADIDDDGDFDLLVGGGTINLYQNTGTAKTPNFTFITNFFAFINTRSGSAPIFVDIDGDRDLDLFMGDQNGNIHFYLNLNTGIALNPEFIFKTTNFANIDVGNFSTPTFTDIDNDGDLDLFVGEQDGNINFYRNAGTVTNPNFSLETENFTSIDVGNFSTPTFSDIDHDGDFDLFVGKEDGNISFYRNTGTVTEPDFTLVTTNFANIDVGLRSTPNLVDIDSDGDLDLFVGEDNNAIHFYRNITPAVPGDVNSDGVVDITDLLLVIDIILRRVSPTPDLIARADVNEDGKVSIGDVVAIIKIILNNQASVVLASKDKALTSAEISLQDFQAGETYLSNLSLTVKLDAAASAAVFLFNYDGNSLSVAEPVLSKNGSGLNLISGSNDNKLIAVIYGINNNLITAGESNLLSLPVTVKENGIKNGLSLESAQFIGANGEIIEIAGNIASSPHLPKTFGLSQNYPNPFNPSTTINYEIPELQTKELDVMLNIYNIRGQLIKALVDEKKTPGYYSAYWDGRDDRGKTVSSGIYYYRIAAGNYKETKKMLLLK